MSDFQAGYAQVNINPPMGIAVCGYYIPRFAKGFLDDLEASAMVLSYAGKQIAIISVDCCFINNELTEKYITDIEKATGLSKENIFMSATHTHTGACLESSDMFDADAEIIRRYAEFVGSRLVDVVKLAQADRHFSTSRTGRGHNHQGFFCFDIIVFAFVPVRRTVLKCFVIGFFRLFNHFLDTDIFTDNITRTVQEQ